MIRSVISYPSYLLDYLFKDAVKQRDNITVSNQQFSNTDEQMQALSASISVSRY